MTTTDPPSPEKLHAPPAGPAVTGLGLPVASFASEEPAPPPPAATVVACPRRRSWRKRRFWGAAAGSLVLAATVAVALHRGSQTRVIFINAGDKLLPPLAVSAAGFTHQVPALEGEASHRWVLPAGGQPSPIIVMPAVQAEGLPWKWESDLIQPEAGSRQILRIWPDGTVEQSTSLSIWIDLLGS